ncbi:MAG: PqqD family protein [Lachnospiraceae bacterium]|nr:PqqD family protein [Lachnospiraceae bacterium]
MSEECVRNTSINNTSDSESVSSRYQADPNFVLREIAGEAILVPTGTAAQRLNGMITLTETGTFLWKQMKTPKTIAELCEAVLEVYDMTEPEVSESVTEFVEKAVTNEMLIIQE